MFFLAFAVLFFVLTAVTCSYVSWCYSYFERKDIPNIKPSLLFGNAQNPLTRKQHPGHICKDLYDKLKIRGYKVGGIYMFTKPVILPVDLQMVCSIMTKNFQNFTDRGLFFNEKLDTLNNNMFFQSGKKWKNLRKKLSPTFSTDKIKMISNIMVECGESLIKAVENHTLQRTAVDIKDLFECFTAEVISSCAFGLKCNRLEEIHTIKKYARRIFQQGPLKVLIAMAFPTLALKLGLTLINDDLAQFFRNIVRDTVEFREKNNYSRNDFMQFLIKLKNDEKNSLTMEELSAHAFVFFVAGYDTSSTVLTFAIYEISINCDIQAKVRKEVRSLFQKHGKFTYECIKEMKYLGQVLDGMSYTLQGFCVFPLIS